MTPPTRPRWYVRPGARLRLGRRVKERGVALIMVMGAIAVLTVMLAEFQDDASTELASALADRDATQAEYMAKSAVNLSRLLVASEPTIRAAIAPMFMLMKRTPPQLPVWEFSDRLLGAFNDQEGSKDFASTVGVDMGSGKNLGLKGGRFELTIVDEDSKINANLGAANEITHIRLAKELMGMMARPEYNPLFEQRDGDGQYHDRMAICQAIIDWADYDENGFSCDMTTAAPKSGGVEDSYYQLLKKPFRRKNAPYDSLEELHMVRGVTDDFWASMVDPEPSQPKKRVMTVWGQGAVNVNTAAPQTLLALVCAGAPQAEICVDPTQASSFLMGLTMAKGFSMGAPLFGSPRDFIDMMTGKGMLGPILAGLGMKPVKFQSEGDFAQSITTESKIFSMYSVGVVKGYKREARVAVHAVVDFRNAPNLQQLAQNATQLAAGVQQQPQTPQTQPGAANPGSTGANAPVDPNAISGAVQPNPGGTVVYYRID